jgi:hypothetical protein
MRLVSMAVRDELVVAIAERYRGSRRWEKVRILDEFVAVTGYHRKHAMRLLREGRADKRSAPRLVRRVYDEAVREALGRPVGGIRSHLSTGTEVSVEVGV